MVTTNFYESLNELVTDSRFRGFSVSQNFENFFNEFGINESESMQAFSWFMNPNGSHGFRDVFFKELLTTSWGMIHGQYSTEFKKLKDIHFYKNVTPLFTQKYSFMNTFVDRDIKKNFNACDFVMTDIGSKTLVVINNRCSKTDCEKAYAYFNGGEYSFFENKLFISFDSEIQSFGDSNWMYMNNEWLVNLCSTLIDSHRTTDARTSSYLQDYYQFLTGKNYGVVDNKITECTSTLVSNFYTTLVELKNFKAEKISTTPLININPREYASMYLGKISEKEYEVLSLYWSHRTTFNTLFNLVDLQGVTKDMDKAIEGKSYYCDRNFIRNGLCFSAVFKKTAVERDYMNNIFDVEVVQDSKKNLVMSLVVNKLNWDKMTAVQKTAIQKNFDFNGTILKDKIAVWNKFYGADWKNKDLTKEVVSLFDKVETYLGKIQIRVA